MRALFMGFALVLVSTQAQAQNPSQTEATGRAPPAYTAVPPNFDVRDAIDNNPRLSSRMARVNALYSNARERDPTGGVQMEQAAALRDLAACQSEACISKWLARRQAALDQWVQ